ncbi:MAG: ribosome silencing factor [Bacteroidetes bacterium]|nr:ribosome silencing factor [Bacteroidota bacterium]
MTETKNVKQNELQSQELCELIVDSIQQTKGEEIVQLDLRDIPEAPADFFVICSGKSDTQVKAITNNLLKQLKDEYGQFPNHVEGQSNSQWILVDFFDVVLHVFYPETRKFYDIENLWGDAKVTAFEA